MSRSSEQIQLFIGTVCDWSAGCYELRCFDADIDRRFNQIVPSNGYRKVMGGWYGRIDAAACEVERVQHVSVYLCPNPADSAFLARRANKVGQIKKGEGVRDEHITRIDWLSIDIDPAKRLSGVSATADELAAALALRDHILASEPALAAAALSLCTGNGGGILLRLPGLPNDEPTRALLKDVLRGLAAKYSNADAKVDTNTYPPSRGVGIPGTQKCKGENTADRPWRYVTLESCGRPVVPIDPNRPLDAYNQRYDVPACDKALLQGLQSLCPQGLRPRTPEGKGGAAGGDAAGGTGKGRKARGTRRGAAGEDEQTFRLRRAEAYVQAMRPAVAGQGGHNKTFEAACALVKGFDLSPPQAATIFRAWNQSHCDPPWDEADLEHKLDEADRKPDDKPRGYLFEQDLKDFRKGKGNGRGKGDGNGNDNDRPNDVAADDDELPEIVVHTKEASVANEAIDALAGASNLYFRGSLLVRVLREQSTEGPIHRKVGTPRISILPKAQLRSILSEVINWVRIVNDPDNPGETKAKPAHPPVWAIDDVMTKGAWPSLNPLKAIVEAPFLRPDGSIVTEAGYDPQTQVLFEPNCEIPEFREKPTLDDAKNSWDILEDIVCDFPFHELVDKAAWITALLTPFARFAYSGCTPLFMFDANSPASGKGLLCDIISLAVTGRKLARMTYTESEEEQRKRITTIAMEGDLMILMDNIAGIFGGSAIDAVLTAESWTDRLLGTNQKTGDIPLNTIWFATGNNIVCKGDIIRRLVRCHLVSKIERPESRSEFRHPNITRYVLENRSTIILHALTILQAYVLAGRPRTCIPVGTFEQWSDLVRSAVIWVSRIDPIETQANMRKADQDANVQEAIVVGLMELASVFDPHNVGMSVLQIIKSLESNPHAYSILREALMTWSNNDDLPSGRVIGRHFRMIRDRVFRGNYQFQGYPYDNSMRWKVATLDGSSLRFDRKALGLDEQPDPTFGTPIPRILPIDPSDLSDAAGSF